MAEQGVHTIAYAFPKVNIVTTAVDPEINDKYDQILDYTINYWSSLVVKISIWSLSS